jgi:methylmalonyl-CoA/ethylmalonyl-CoA epimerase
MLKIRKIEHVAIAVEDVDAATAKFREVFGLEPSEREYVPAQKTETVCLPIGDANLELISPRGNEGLAKFLEKRGPGLHHIAIEVEGIDAALAFLKGIGENARAVGCCGNQRRARSGQPGDGEDEQVGGMPQQADSDDQLDDAAPQHHK